MTRRMRHPDGGGLGHPEIPFCAQEGCVPVEPKPKPRQMTGNFNTGPHAGVHDESTWCAEEPACVPVEPKPELRRMAANLGTLPSSPHHLEHDEEDGCSVSPRCTPLDDTPAPAFTIETRYLISDSGYAYRVRDAEGMQVVQKFGFGTRGEAVKAAKEWCDQKAKAMQPVETITYTPEVP